MCGFVDVGGDLILFQNIWLDEQWQMCRETSLGTISNRTIFCAPNSNSSARSFGRVIQQCNIPRSI